MTKMKKGGVGDDEQEEEIERLGEDGESDAEDLAGLVELTRLCEQHVNQL
jgi:hypothetical protein